MRDIGIRSFLKFLRRINAEFPGDIPLHLMDNYGTHKHAKVKAWLKRNPRLVSHFVPTSSSWMNLSGLGIWIPNPSFGTRRSNPFRKSSPAVVEPWSRSSPAAPAPSPESGRNELSSYFEDTTLALRRSRGSADRREVRLQCATTVTLRRSSYSARSICTG